MRKIATPLVILTLCLSLLCACSKNAPTAEPPAPALSAEPSTLPETAAPSEEPVQTAEPSALPETPSPTPEPSTPPETPAPSEEPVQTAEPSALPETPSPTPEPSETPASEPEPEPSEPEKVDLRAFYRAVFQGPDSPMMVEIDGKDMLDAYYPGLSAVQCEQSAVFMAAMSAVAVEIALVEVSDPKDVATVKRIFQERVIAQVGTDDAPGGAWYPASIESWKKNSRFASSGNYAMLIVSENCDEVVRRFNALFE